MSEINWRPETAEEEARMLEHLAPEEREILEAQNAEEYTFPPPASPEDVQRFQAIAHNTLAKSARIGYQTLIASLVHQYVTGQLVSRD